MRARKHRTAIAAGKLVLTLLLAPLLLQSHIHAATDAVAHPCATCAIGHHAPITPATTVSLLTQLPPTLAPAPSVSCPVLRATRSAIAVRAPPADDASCSV
jgi:hypothetical protein